MQVVPQPIVQKTARSYVALDNRGSIQGHPPALIYGTSHFDGHFYTSQAIPRYAE
ncbi:hypothetical protein H6F89_22430 [Cyanobacteria bacterium FACHB-63]|nr:hypothetical protein [Cyanobacteria bacterium FACHB-63]